jgi:DNA-binding beta-propeller fold protein YncE
MRASGYRSLLVKKMKIYSSLRESSFVLPALAILAATAWTGCTETVRTSSGGGSNRTQPAADSGVTTPSPDAAAAAGDATTTLPPTDAGTTIMDTGTTVPPPHDAGNAPADSGTQGPSGVPVLGNGQHTSSSVNIEVIANANDGLDMPTDVDFNPENSDLWVVNQGDSTFTVLTISGTSVTGNRLAGNGAHLHFLAKPSALAFGAMGCGFRCLASSHDSMNDQPQTTGGAPNDFMGPTLWTSDASMYRGNGPYHSAHFDMLHNSPQGKGIAWERDNIFWYFDSYHESITRYNFNNTHGGGGSDHSDGEISRWVQGFVSGVNNVPSHLDFDHSTNLLYIADTGNNRIATLNTASGTRGRDYNEDYDGVTRSGGGGMYYVQAQVNTLIAGSAVGLVQPSGIAVHGDYIFVSDHANGRIWAFTKSGAVVDYLETGRNSLAGLTFDTAGKLIIADKNRDEILRISP